MAVWSSTTVRKVPTLLKEILKLQASERLDMLRKYGLLGPRPPDGLHEPGGLAAGQRRSGGRVARVQEFVADAHQADVPDGCRDDSGGLETAVPRGRRGTTATKEAAPRPLARWAKGRTPTAGALSRRTDS